MGPIPALAWPTDEDRLISLQRTMAGVRGHGWRPGGEVPLIGACFACFGRNITGHGRAGEPGWAGAVVGRGRRPGIEVAIAGAAGATYVSGLLAMREGPLLETAVRALPQVPDVLLVNATGRDHPRGFGLATHLGAVLDIPTVGVTHRLLLATGREPSDRRGAVTELTLGGRVVGHWVRTRPGTRPIAVHAGWRTDPDTAVAIVMTASRRARTPEPMRRARRAARSARAAALQAPTPSTEQ